MVQGDRIQSIRGIKGAYTRENDETQGEVYLLPTAAYQHQAFTVLLSTEQGRHFTLLLNPMAVPSDTLMLIPRDEKPQITARLERTASYDLTLAHLIRAMVQEQKFAGYETVLVKDQKPYRLGRIAWLRLKTVYQGAHLYGQIFELTNLQPYSITLDERSFFNAQVLAVSLETSVVKPRAKTLVYRILQHV